MAVEVKESFQKTRHVKNIDKSKKYVLRGHRNARYHEKKISNKKNSSLQIMHVLKQYCVENTTVV